LERGDISDSLAGKYVDLYDFADRPLEVQWKEHSLPYRVFSKHQRVSHTAVIENNRLGHVLVLVKAQQELEHQPKVQTIVKKAATRNAAEGSMVRITK
jgi:hypothetical protein